MSWFDVLVNTDFNGMYVRLYFGLVFEEKAVITNFIHNTCYISSPKNLKYFIGVVPNGEIG